MKKKHSLFLLLPAVAMVATGCFGKKDPGTNTGGNTDSGQTDDDHGGGEQQTVAVTGVSLNKNASTIEVGKKETLVATVAPENATNKNVTWESSAPAVATVANGVVTAVAPGNADIKVKTADGNKEATCKITVKEAAAVLESITVSEAHRTFEQNDEFVGETITAHYSNGSTKTVEGTFSGYNLATLGEQTVNVSYTEQGVTKTTTYTITVNERAPEVEGAVYTFTNSDGKALNMGSMNSDEFMNHVVLDGAPIITGMANPVNSYIGANGGSGDGAWNIWNCLKVGKSSGKGSLTLTLHPEATFSKIKMEVIGSRDDGTLTVNGITKDVPKKAIKDDLEPITLYFNISENTGELNISSKDMASNNYAISILRIAFIDGAAPLPAPVLDSLEVTQAPNKVNYFAGDNFDPTGMIITAKYTNNGEDKVIPSTDYSIDKTALALGDDHVTVSYTEDGITKTVNVNVNVTKAPVPVTGVTLNQTELSIKVNDADAALVATVAPEDADDKTVVWSVSQEGIVTVNGGVIHAVSAGTVTVTATAGDFHADCLVTVGAAEKVISGIEVVTPPTKVVYVEGETFDPTGMVIRVNYSSGHESITVTTGFTYSDAQLQLGTEAVDIEYNGFHASVAITTNPAPVLDSITVANAEGKSNEYIVGDIISKEDLVVTAHYTQGKADAVVTDYVISKTEALSVEDTSVTITYTEGGVEKTAVYTISVAEPAREAIPYVTTINPSTHLFENWTGDAEVFSTTYPVLKASGKAISYVKMFDARNKVRVVVDGVCNGTTTDSLVTVYGLDDTGAAIEGVSEAFTPKKASASNGAAVDNAAAKNTVVLEGEGITGIKVELTTKGHNYVMRSIEVKEPPVAVSGVSLDKTELTMKVNEADETLVATVAPENAENKEVVWSSDNEPVATVNNGVIHAVSAGTAHITVTTADGSKTATCTVTVQASEKILTGIEITGAPTKTEYFVGDKFDPAGMVVTAHYSNAADEAITGYTYSDEALVAGQIAVVISWNGKDANCPITVAVPKGTTVDNPFTIAEVIEASSGLGDNQWLPTRVFVEGKVKGYAASSSNKYTLVDESGTEFIVYKSQLPSGDRACIGDTVIMEGWVENYHPASGANTLEMTSNNDGVHGDLPTTAVIVERGTSKISLDSNSSANAVVTFEENATNATAYSFTVEAEAGYQIVSVKFNDQIIEGDNGTYNVKVMGASKILVQTVEEGQKLPVTVSKSITDLYEIAKEAAGGAEVIQTNVTSIALDNVITLSTTGGPNCGYIGASKGSPTDWRLYQAASGNLIVTATTGYQINTIKVTYSISNSATLLNGTTQVKSNDVVTVNGTSITLTVGNTKSDVTNGQVKVTAIEVVYVAI